MMNKHDEQGHSENTQPSRSGCCFFEIHVKGHLDNNWSDWFENMDIKLLDNGEMILSGVIVDQAALMGILNKLNRLNLTLLSVSEVSKKE
jgi:hypothetical protein